MKPTARLRCNFNVFATTPCRGLSLSREMLKRAFLSAVACALVALSLSYPAEKKPVYVWDGTSELVILTNVTDSVTHRPISGATVSAIRVGHDTEPLTNEHPKVMPPPQKTNRGGRARLVAYFRSAGDAEGFCVFVGDSFVRVHAHGYQSKEVRISPIVRLDFAPKTKHCEVTIPITLTHQ